MAGSDRGLAWFALYPEAFYSDPAVVAMSLEEVGAYALLWCQAWRQFPPGTLPDDDDLLARICKISTRKWKTMKNRTMAGFDLRSDARWHQPHLEREYAKSLQKSEKARNSADVGWAKRRANAYDSDMRTHFPSNANAMLSTSTSTSTGEPPYSPPVEKYANAYDSPAPPGVLPKGKKRRDYSTDPDFVKFYSTYPRKENKEHAATMWCRLSPTEKQAALDAVGPYAASWELRPRTDRQFIPHPGSWLSRKRWQDVADDDDPPQPTLPLPNWG